MGPRTRNTVALRVWKTAPVSVFVSFLVCLCAINADDSAMENIVTEKRLRKAIDRTVPTC
uniref:Uncharacterized protein n=1 Tax=Anguilla anguilla TaxID=7936 RepID=A0A0E9VKC9_ANGAN